MDIADYLNGLAMQKYRPKDGETGLPVLKIKELRQGICDASSELCSPSIKSEYIIHDGDIIFSWSGSLLVDIWCGGTCGLNQHLFKVTSNNYDKCSIICGQHIILTDSLLLQQIRQQLWGISKGKNLKR